MKELSLLALDEMDSLVRDKNYFLGFLKCRGGLGCLLVFYQAYVMSWVFIISCIVHMSCTVCYLKRNKLIKMKAEN